MAPSVCLLLISSIVELKVAQNEVVCASMTFHKFCVEIFTEDVECYPERSSCSKNSVIHVSMEKSVFLIIHGHFHHLHELASEENV